MGRGSTGTTFHVISTLLEKEFALKAIKLTEGFSKEWIERLEAQTSLVSRLTHCNIDRIVNSGRSGKLWRGSVETVKSKGVVASLFVVKGASN